LSNKEISVIDSSSVQKKLDLLYKSNLYACLLHSTWVIFIIAVVASVGAPYKISVQKMFQIINTDILPDTLKTNVCNGTMYTNVFEWFDCVDNRIGRVGPQFTVDPYELFELPVWIILLLFEIITALSHGILCIYRNTYENLLKIQIQPFRWFEYSITCSLMTIILMGLSNVVDIYLFLAMYTLSVFYNIYGGLIPEIINSIKNTEKYKKFSTLLRLLKIHSLLVCWFAFILTFVLIWDNFVASINPYLDLENGELWEQLFGFILILNVVLLLSFLCFPLIQIVQFAFANNLNVYLNCEFAYIISSFVAKTMLTFIILVSAINRED
jgi:hypothetical protein